MFHWVSIAWIVGNGEWGVVVQMSNEQVAMSNGKRIKPENNG
jgi:hypothetical protein